MQSEEKYEKRGVKVSIEINLKKLNLILTENLFFKTLNLKKLNKLLLNYLMNDYI